MISFIRKMFESKLGAILAIAFVAIIGIAFAMGDVSHNISSSGVSGGSVARVGSHDITEAELSDAMDTAFKQIQRENPGLTMAAFIQQGGFDDVFASLVDRVTVGAYAEKHGMAVSKAMVDAEIRNVPAFKGLDGAFNQQTFQDVLRQNNLTEDQFREDVRRSLYLEQLLSVAGVGTKAAKSMALPYASLILEERQGQLGIVPSGAFVPKKDPTDQQLAAFYQENRAAFTIPERRAIRYARFGSDAMAGKVQVTDADIAKYYNDNRADYAASQERSLSQIIVPTEAAAKAVEQRAAKGESLDAIASDIGVAVSNADNVSRADYASQTSEAVAQAAFGAAIGSIAAPARGDLGWYVVRANSGRSIAAKPLASVSADIRKTLTTQRTQEALDEMTGEIEDRLANGATIAEIAKSVGAEVKTTPPVLQQGGSPDAPQFKLPEELAPVREAAFQMEADSEPQLIQLGAEQQFAVVGIASVEAAAPPPDRENPSAADRRLEDFRGVQGGSRAGGQGARQRQQKHLAEAGAGRQRCAGAAGRSDQRHAPGTDPGPGQGPAAAADAVLDVAGQHQIAARAAAAGLLYRPPRQAGPAQRQGQQTAGCGDWPAADAGNLAGILGRFRRRDARRSGREAQPGGARQAAGTADRHGRIGHWRIARRPDRRPRRPPGARS